MNCVLLLIQILALLSFMCFQHMSANGAAQTLTVKLPSNTKTNLINGSYQAGSISLSWIGNSNSTNFTMSSSGMSAGKYFAFGLSTDQAMSDDDVAACKVNFNGTVSVNHNYNGVYVSSLLSTTSPAIGFSNIATSFRNGVATCTFTRANSLPSVIKYFNLKSQYYLLTASGPLSPSGAVGYHSDSNQISFKIFNFRQP